MTIVVALKKLNKSDYGQFRVYYLIIFLECISKLLEKVVACRLTYIID